MNRNCHNWRDQTNNVPCSLQNSDCSDGSAIILNSMWPKPMQEKTHPHDQKPLPNSQNCYNRRKDYNSSRLDSKTYGENTMPKIARSPGQKSQFAPAYRYRYLHHNSKARQHTSFNVKHRIYQTLKMAFNHPSSSKNITGVITSHHFATLPGLKPVHYGDSHKQEIPAKSTQS